MWRALLLLLSVCCLCACGDGGDEPTGPCTPATDPICADEDFDGDGVLNGEDGFPEDPACSIRGTGSCSACGVPCAGFEICTDQGACACESPYGGDACDRCLDSLFAVPGCTDCVDPVFTGSDCTECADTTFAGADCTECANPLFTGPQCDQCADPTKTGVNCNLDVEESPEVDGLICPALDACVFEICAYTPQEDLEVCITDALVACGEPASEEELSLAQAVLDCKRTACDTYGPSTANYDCWRNSCIEPIVDCLTATFGDTDCRFMGGEVAECFADDGTIDWNCYRGGISNGTEVGVTHYIQLELCREGQCFDKEYVEACKVEVAGFHPTCGQVFFDCGI